MHNFNPQLANLQQQLDQLLNNADNNVRDIKNNLFPIGGPGNPLPNIMTPFMNPIVRHALNVQNEPIQYDPLLQNRLEALNSVSKAFSKLPYTSLIECSNILNAPLYLALPDGLRNNIAPNQIINIAHRLNDYIQNPVENQKVELYRALYFTWNKIVTENIEIDLLRNENLINLTRRNGLPVAHLEAHHDLLSNMQVGQVNFNDQAVRDYAEQKIEAIWSSEQINNMLLPEHHDILEKLTAPLNPNQPPRTVILHSNDYTGYHVEFKGLHEIRERHPEVREFNFGLAHYQNNNPSSCSMCTNEKNVVTNIQGLTINVTAVSPYNLPPGFYQPSLNMTRDAESFHGYLNETLNICNSIKDNQNVRNNVNPALFNEMNESTARLNQEINNLAPQIQEINALKQNIHHLEAQMAAGPLVQAVPKRGWGRPPNIEGLGGNLQGRGFPVPQRGGGNIPQQRGNPQQPGRAQRGGQNPQGVRGNIQNPLPPPLQQHLPILRGAANQPVNQPNPPLPVGKGRGVKGGPPKGGPVKRGGRGRGNIP